MAVNYKILGQAIPAANTNATLYTAPANTQALLSTLVVCNQANTAATFRIAAVASGESLAAKNYTNYDVAIGANDSINLTLGMSLGAGDSIRIYNSSSSISYTAFGSEITAV